jgi:hypothetical protein
MVGANESLNRVVNQMSIPISYFKNLELDNVFWNKFHFETKLEFFWILSRGSSLGFRVHHWRFIICFVSYPSYCSLHVKCCIFSPSSFCKWVLVYIFCSLPPSNHDKLIIIALVILSSLHLLCTLFLLRGCHHNSYPSFTSKFLRFLSFELIILWSQNIVQRNQGILLFNVMHSSMQVFCSLLFP